MTITASDIHNQDLSDHKQQVAVEAPPSPLLTQEDLMLQDLEVKHSKKHAFISPTNSTDLFTPQPEERGSYLHTATMHNNDRQPRQSAEQMAATTIREFKQMVYWEIPGRSAITFFTILAALILTRYYSLLYLFTGAFTILTAFNLVFVNTYNFIRSAWLGCSMDELDHPYRIRMLGNHTYANGHLFSNANRVLFELYIHRSVDLIEFLSHQVLRLVLVEDSKKTVIAFFGAYAIYSFNFILSFKTLLILLTCALFTVPYHYQQNQLIVDEHIEIIHTWCKARIEEYSKTLVIRIQTLYDTYGGDYFRQFTQYYLKKGLSCYENIVSSYKKQNQQQEVLSTEQLTDGVTETPQK